MPATRTRDIEIYYEMHGTGPAILHISGSGNDLRQSAPGANPLNHDFTGLHYDQRGLGRTTVGDHPPTMADFADDAAALLDAVGWGRAHVVGVSFGGMVAQHLAIRHPDRVDRLVLCCTSPGGSRPSYPLHELEDLDPAQRVDRYLRIMDQRYDGDIDAVPGLRPVLEHLASRTDGDAGSGTTSEGARAQLDARRYHDTVDQLREIECPTLVAAGRYDGVAPIENSQFLASCVPDSILEVFEGGHAFMMQDRAVFPTLRDFLSPPP